ncbi:uncharacterized protein K452DRAFT_286209 [Aplosporella prunicola CBS 121167]|uniref:Uncharacterized protein n=1 Tax=Aplosporella prunicola CBS 121167 TaxID=1176127 RepID=A0A6A6BLD7_9PEZI|nr:uncharacterized protein K452DRAFT_286209 [Aplosporella prunicola CBS 121167]KAF2143381.1 hypothetical protein K452DRAFT_286209 [Aplosporella prunicola CBS 121167]
MQGGVREDATVSRILSSASDVSQAIPTGNILGDFVLPPLLTHDLYPPDNLEPALSPADPKTAGELLPPRTEPSLVYSPTCSSADTVSSWADEAFSSLDSSFDDMSDYGFSKYQTHSDSDSCELESPPVASPESPQMQSHLGGFQGYSLSSEYTASEVTLTKVSTRQTTCTIVAAESPMRSERLSVGQGAEPLDPELKDMVELVTDFGYLGGALFSLCRVIFPFVAFLAKATRSLALLLLLLWTCFSAAFGWMAICIPRTLREDLVSKAAWRRRTAKHAAGLWPWSCALELA